MTILTLLVTTATTLRGQEQEEDLSTMFPFFLGTGITPPPAQWRHNRYPQSFRQQALVEGLVDSDKLYISVRVTALSTRNGPRLSYVSAQVRLIGDTRLHGQFSATSSIQPQHPSTSCPLCPEHPEF